MLVGVHPCNLLHEPWEISTKDETPYKVFTPFWKACTAEEEPDFPLRAPQRIEKPERWPESLEIDGRSPRSARNPLSDPGVP